jgi:dCMP deaminase
MAMAKVISELSTCNKRQVGAVLVKNNRVISMGFNGSPSGCDHCNQGECYIGGPPCRRAVHAETNAIIAAALHGVCTEESTLYCTLRPCLECSKAIINAGITHIYYLEGHDSHPLAYQLLGQAEVEIWPFSKLMETQ